MKNDVHTQTTLTIVHTDGLFLGWVAHVLGISEDVDGDTGDRGQKDLEVVPSEELGEHAAGVFEQGSSQLSFWYAQTVCNSWEVPARVNGRLRASHLDTGVDIIRCSWQPLRRDNDLVVKGNAAQLECFVDFWHLDMCLCHSNCRANVDSILELLAEELRCQVSPRIQGHNSARSKPIWVGFYVEWRFRVGEVGSVVGVELADGHGQSAVDWQSLS